MRTSFFLLLFFAAAVACGADLEKGPNGRWDGAFGYGEIKVNNKHVKPQSPHLQYDPEAEINHTGFMADQAHGSVTSGTSGADAWSYIASYLSPSLQTPSLVVGHGYTTLCVVGPPPGSAPNTRARAHASGNSDHWAKYRHPGGNLGGSIKLSGEVGKADADFKGEMFAQLGSNHLTAKYNIQRRGWDVTGRINGQPVNKQYPRKFADTWNTIEAMRENTWFDMKGRINGTQLDFLTKGLKSSADNYGSGSVPMRTDDAKMQIQVKVNP